MAKTRYNFGLKTLHWAIVGLLAAQFVLVLVRSFIHRAEFHDAYLEFQLIQIHKSLGATIVALVPIRLLWRWIGGLPDWPDGVAEWEKSASSGVENWLYGLLLIVPVSGAASTIASGAPLLWFGYEILPALISASPAFTALALFVHTVLIYLLLIVFALHIGLVFRRSIYERDSYHKRIFLKA